MPNLSKPFTEVVENSRLSISCTTEQDLCRPITYYKEDHSISPKGQPVKTVKVTYLKPSLPDVKDDISSEEEDLYLEGISDSENPQPQDAVQWRILKLQQILTEREKHEVEKYRELKAMGTELTPNKKRTFEFLHRKYIKNLIEYGYFQVEPEYNSDSDSTYKSQSPAGSESDDSEEEAGFGTNKQIEDFVVSDWDYSDGEREYQDRLFRKVVGLETPSKDNNKPNQQKNLLINDANKNNLNSLNLNSEANEDLSLGNLNDSISEGLEKRTLSANVVKGLRIQAISLHNTADRPCSSLLDLVNSELPPQAKFRGKSLGMFMKRQKIEVMRLAKRRLRKKRKLDRKSKKEADGEVAESESELEEEED